MGPGMIREAENGFALTKENDMTTNTTKTLAKLAVAIALLGGLAFSSATPSLAQPGSAYQTHGNNDSMGCPCP
jgi:hypothetical protein